MDDEEIFSIFIKIKVMQLRISSKLQIQTKLRFSTMNPKKLDKKRKEKEKKNHLTTKLLTILRKDPSPREEEEDL